MIAAFDVLYDDNAATGVGAAVIFADWADLTPTAAYTATFSAVEQYESGQFFKRELPCLLALLSMAPQQVGTVVIDGYVSLGDKPGLGMHLWKALGELTAVIGVAKNSFRDAEPIEVTRGASKRPLFVTAVGVEPANAAAAIGRMHGAHRIPTLLKLVDQLTRVQATRPLTT